MITMNLTAKSLNVNRLSPTQKPHAVVLWNSKDREKFRFQDFPRSRLASQIGIEPTAFRLGVEPGIVKQSVGMSKKRREMRFVFPMWCKREIGK